MGEYVSGSFKVDDGAVTSGVEYDTDKILKYQFGDVESPVKISFQTEIRDEDFYTDQSKIVGNTAGLVDKVGQEFKSNLATVTINPTWIDKVGLWDQKDDGGVGSSGSYNPEDQTITWTITANQYGVNLPGVVITDTIDNGLEFVSAQGYKKDGENWEEVNGWKWNGDNPPANGNKFEFGDISSPIMLEITTRLKNPVDFNPTTSVTPFENSASIHWSTYPGSGTGPGASSPDVGIGYNPLSKSGAWLTGQTIGDAKNPVIEWTVEVAQKGQSFQNFVVYDLLVYGKSGSYDYNQIAVADLPASPENFKTTILKNLTPQYGQKYVENTFESTSLSLQVIQLKVEGKAVADLLIISLPGDTNDHSFTFRSYLTDPDVFAGNKTSTIYNTATLFSGNVRANVSTASSSYSNAILGKDMLKREKNPLDATNNNDYTTNASEGFNYDDKSVIFRLVVNEDSLNLPQTINPSGVTASFK